MPSGPHRSTPQHSTAHPGFASVIDRVAFFWVIESMSVCEPTRVSGSQYTGDACDLHTQDSSSNHLAHSKISDQITGENSLVSHHRCSKQSWQLKLELLSSKHRCAPRLNNKHALQIKCVLPGPRPQRQVRWQVAARCRCIGLCVLRQELLLRPSAAPLSELSTGRVFEMLTT